MEYFNLVMAKAKKSNLELWLFVVAMSFPVIYSLAYVIGFRIKLPFLTTVVYEIAFIIVYFSLHGIKPYFNWRLVVYGILLFIVSNVLLNSIDYLGYFNSNYSTHEGADITYINALFLIIIGPIFEELFLVKVLFKSSDRIIIIGLCSIFFRCFIHSYMGDNAIISSFVIGIIYTVFYIRYNHLLPLIVAHCLMNFSILYV